MKPADWLLFGLVILVAIVLGALHLCPYDWLWAAVTIGVVVFWTWLLARQHLNNHRDERLQARTSVRERDWARRRP